MDYRELLKRYMRLVSDSEGSDFLKHNGSHGNIELTDEEMDELERISAEGDADGWAEAAK